MLFMPIVNTTAMEPPTIRLEAQAIGTPRVSARHAGPAS